MATTSQPHPELNHPSKSSSQYTKPSWGNEVCTRIISIRCNWSLRDKRIELQQYCHKFEDMQHRVRETLPSASLRCYIHWAASPVTFSRKVGGFNLLQVRICNASSVNNEALKSLDTLAVGLCRSISRIDRRDPTCNVAFNAGVSVEENRQSKQQLTEHSNDFRMLNPFRWRECCAMPSAYAFDMIDSSRIG